MLQILIFLWFIAHEAAGFRDVADRFGIAISTLHKTLQRVVIFVSNLSGQVIKWPDDEHKRIIENNFNENGFPGVIGAIDGCHVKIDKPENDPESYINRKGYYSVQVNACYVH